MTKDTAIPVDYTPKILVVDDEQRIRDACSMILQEDGYAVMTAANGIQGVEMITKHHFDIILLDLMMPSLSGFDVLASTKKLHPDAVVIVITGYATLEHSVEAMKKGAFDFIPKPFTPDHLRVVTSKALEYTLALRDIANTGSRLHTMVDRLSDGVMCVNRQGTVVFANPAFLDMIGHGREIDMINQPVKSVVKDGQILEMIAAAMQMEKGASADLNAEIVVQPDAGARKRVLDVHCVPFRDRSGINLGVITVLHDITVLRHMDQMKSNFVSMVSHEIRSPMNSLLMQLQVIMDGLAGAVTEKQMEILQRASMKIESLSQMTSDLLDLAGIESGLVFSKKEPVGMVNLIKEQQALHLPQAESQSIALTLDLPAELPVVTADRRNMEAVLSNLITNALKYTPAGGRVNLSAAVCAQELCVRVSDTGFGFDQTEKEAIFKRFYRIKNPQTRHIQGTGLGLAIVKAIIEDHQGRIMVDSAPGVGSTFSVFLPLARDLRQPPLSPSR